MEEILRDRSKLVPLLIVSLVIAVGATLIILLTDDATGGGSAATAPVPADASAQGGVSVQGGPGQAVPVEIVDFAYDPEPITVKAGTEITWTNADSAPHTATAEDDSFDTSDLDQGEMGSATFEQSGSFAYICEFHPFMHGTVVVE